MPFYQTYGAEGIVDDNCTTTEIIDAALKQKENFWRGAWYYAVDGDEMGEYRKVTSFQSELNKIRLEYGLSGAPSAGEKYEIISIWSPEQIHEAINDAITEGFPAFYEVEEDVSLCLVEDQMKYDISDISNLYKIRKIWIEDPTTGETGTAQSGTADTIVVADGTDLSDVDDDWYVSVYGGTGKGQVRQVDSVVDGTDTITVASSWTTNPDSTSKYRFWNPVVQERPWIEVTAARFDRKQWPDYMYLTSDYNTRLGCRIKIQYIKQPQVMDDDTDTTVVPKRYIILKSKAILFGQRGGDPRTRQGYQAMSVRFDEQAENYKGINAFPMPDQAIWQESDNRIVGGEVLNPLGW
jgi:hypothetical protein